MKELSDIELKNASILDFTDDIKLIRRAMDWDGLTMERIKEFALEERMISLFAYFEYTEDETMVRRLEKLFSDELAARYNE